MFELKTSKILLINKSGVPETEIIHNLVEKYQETCEIRVLSKHIYNDIETITNGTQLTNYITENFCTATKKIIIPDEEFMSLASVKDRREVFRHISMFCNAPHKNEICFIIFADGLADKELVLFGETDKMEV